MVPKITVPPVHSVVIRKLNNRVHQAIHVSKLIIDVKQIYIDIFVVERQHCISRAAVIIYDNTTFELNNMYL